MKEPCMNCQGTGFMDWAEDKSILCKHCKGTGTKESEQIEELKQRLLDLGVVFKKFD